MIDMKPYGWPLLALVAVVQTGVLGKMVWDRDRLIKTGREIALPVTPVDPRDVMRGDYVILGYDITQIPLPSATESSNLGAIRRGDAVFVTLQPTPDRGWLVTGLANEYPARAASGEVVLKGRVTHVPPTADRAPATAGEKISVHYGIERYFVPEGTGGKLEADVRDKKIQAIVAIGPDGTAAIKGLMIDGERHEAPPML